MIATSDAARRNYTIQAGQFYGHEDYEVQQILFPDRSGRYLDDPRCDYRLPVLAQVLQ